MATRFYLNTGTAGDLSLTRPLPSGGVWETNVGSLPTTRRISTVALGTANNASAPYGQANTIGNGTNPNDVLYFQGISGALAAQTISGTVTGVACVREGNTADNIFTQLAIFVVDSTGAKVATLWGGQTSGGTEANSPSANTRYLTRASSQTISSYTCAAGDRIVIEVGLRTESTRTTAVGYMYLGDPGGSDLGASDGGSNNLTINPWVELSANITLNTPNVVAAITGGGVAVVVDATERSSVVAATGGGVASVAAAKSASATVADTGGGVAVVSETTARRSVVAATGGGVEVVAQTTSRPSVIADTGGGVVTPSVVASRQSVVALTGGGAVAIDYTVGAAATAEVVAALTGGGVVTPDATTQRSVVPSVTGGGAVAPAYTAEHDASAQVTGGGAVVPVHVGEHSSSTSVTASGAVTPTSAAARASAPSVTGGGVQVVVGVSARAATAAVTGGGVEVVASASAHAKIAAVTGGGVASVARSAVHNEVAALTGGGVIRLPLRLTVQLALTGGGQVTSYVSAKASMNFPSVALQAHYDYPNGPDDPSWVP